MALVEYERVWRAQMETAARLRLYLERKDWDQIEIEASYLANLPDPKFLVDIRELGLTTRARQCLKSQAIRYTGDLVQWSESNLLKTPNLGKVTLEEIKRALNQRGLTLDMQLPSWPPRFF